MGLDVKIDEKKGGPLVETIDIEKIKSYNDVDFTTLNPVLEAIKLTRQNLPQKTKLIGFCGAPWTLAVYMLQGKSSSNNEITHKTAYKNRKEFTYLIEILTHAICDYLCAQIQAGCDTVQLFDSWASFLSPENFTDFVLNPAIKIVNHVKNKYPNVTFIGFPRGAGQNYREYAQKNPS